MATTYIDQNKRTWALAGTPPTLRAIGDYAGSPQLTGLTQADLAVQIEAYALDHPVPPSPSENEKSSVLPVMIVLGALGVMWGLSRK